jgi:hypothetical protein
MVGIDAGFLLDERYLAAAIFAAIAVATAIIAIRRDWNA